LLILSKKFLLGLGIAPNFFCSFGLPFLSVFYAPTNASSSIIEQLNWEENRVVQEMNSFSS
jgi:hypothetical protein